MIYMQLPFLKTEVESVTPNLEKRVDGSKCPENHLYIDNHSVLLQINLHSMILNLLTQCLYLTVPKDDSFKRKHTCERVTSSQKSHQASARSPECDYSISLGFVAQEPHNPGRGAAEFCGPNVSNLNISA